MICVEGVVYSARGVDGDFAHMIDREENANTVFIFNDNVLDASATRPFPGGGSAAIRTRAFRYNTSAAPRAIGIPTGWCIESGGFGMNGDRLEPFASRAIILEIERLVIACIQHPSIKRIVYTADPKNPARIGTAIFKTDERVMDFIKARIDEVPGRVAAGDTRFTLDRIAAVEADQIVPVARLHHQLCTSRFNRCESYGGGIKRAVDDSHRSQTLLQPGGMKRPADDSHRFQTFFQKKTAQEATNLKLHYIGITASGQHLYERLPTCKVSRPVVQTSSSFSFRTNSNVGLF